MALVFLNNTLQHLPLQPRLILLIQTSLHPEALTLLDGQDALKGSLPPSCPAALDLLPSYPLPAPGGCPGPPFPSPLTPSPRSPFNLLPFIPH